MQVASYTYQSPSPSATQVGRLDPASVKEETSVETESDSLDITTQVQKEAQSLVATQTSEVTPSVETERLLDIYA